MLKRTLIVLVAVLGIFAAVVASRPADFRVTRSAVMDAPPAAVFAQVNDFHKWEAWSPWAKMDPKAVSTFGGPASGVGATFQWAGNSQVGAGRMIIAESRPDERIQIELRFLKPMKATDIAEFTFAKAATGTRVTWTMSGKNNFISKAFTLFVDCDKMIGGQFEKGLAQMKTIVESAPKA